MEVLTANMKREVPADILPLRPNKHLRLVASWKPLLKKYKQEDASWDWKRILTDAQQAEERGEGKFEHYALDCEAGLQALMTIETKARRSRVTGARIVYVEYLATAPSNRPRIQKPPRFKGCGSAMIRMAALRSRALGFGCVGLHSKPDAEDFYRGAGFTDFGPDEAEDGLRYFERGFDEE
mgnify:FL=1